MRAAPLLFGGLLIMIGVVWAWVASAARPAAVGSPPEVAVVLAHPQRPGVVYAGARGGVFASDDDGARWRRIFPARGAAIHDLAVAPSRPTTIYVATDRGMERSQDGGLHWRPRSHPVAEEDQAVLAVAVHPMQPDTVAIGTGRGARVSRDGGLTWQPAAGAAAGAVSAILYHPVTPAFLYLVSAAGLFRSADGGAHWARVLVAVAAGEEEQPEAQEPVGEPEGTSAGQRVGSVAVDATRPSWIYAGTDRGVWESPDAGETWTALPSVGLGHPTIRHLLTIPDDPDHLWAATDAGMFVYSRQGRGWRASGAGVPTRDVRRLAWGGRGTVWVATDRGLFQIPWPSPAGVPGAASGSPPAAPVILESFVGEPTIAEVQTAAVHYAEVMPQKIQSWRARAAWRAWVPHVTLSVNRDRDTTIGSSSSGGKTTFTVGPEDRSMTLNYGFTWDLADLVWNPDQTSIDTRSRLMVQLRGDILDEATRIYFERRRLQVEFALHPAGEPALRAEQQLRIEELAAQLDGLTGGWFSQQSQLRSDPVRRQRRN